LPLILTQNYPCFEVVVVNDGSTDETQQLLLDFQEEHAILHIINREQSKSGQLGKKFALTDGIHAASHDVLLLTDADCTPRNNDWLRSMQSFLTEKKSIVLGYSPYLKEKTFLNLFIRYETVWTAIQYLSFAIWGHPYMGVGRNMMYRKSLFYKAGGFQSHEHIASGDDDLFINAIAHLNNTTVNIDETSFVYSAPKRTWRAWYRQKTRHYSTSTSYRPKHQVLLGLLSLSHFGHLLLGTLLIFLGYFPMVFIGYIIRISIILLVSRYILRKLEETDLWVWFPVLDIAMVWYYIVFAPILFFGSKRHW
ncbi:MAG: glycosyltransferase, partial [Bacteroidota bacterium]